MAESVELEYVYGNGLIILVLIVAQYGRIYDEYFLSAYICYLMGVDFAVFVILIDFKDVLADFLEAFSLIFL